MAAKDIGEHSPMIDRPSPLHRSHKISQGMRFSPEEVEKDRLLLDKKEALRDSKKLLLFPSFLERKKELITSLLPEIVPVEYEWESGSFQQLARQLKLVLGGKRASHLTMLHQESSQSREGDSAEFLKLFRNQELPLSHFSDDPEQLRFWWQLAQMTGRSGRMDLITSELSGEGNREQSVTHFRHLLSLLLTEGEALFPKDSYFHSDKVEVERAPLFSFPEKFVSDLKKGFSLQSLQENRKPLSGIQDSVQQIPEEERERLLLLSSRIQDLASIEKLLHEKTKILTYDWENSSLKQLEMQIAHQVKEGHVHHIAALIDEIEEFQKEDILSLAKQIKFFSPGSQIHDGKNDRETCFFWRHLSKVLSEKGAADLIYRKREGENISLHSVASVAFPENREKKCFNKLLIHRHPSNDLRVLSKYFTRSHSEGVRVQEKKKIVVLSSQVPDREFLEMAAQEDVILVKYNWERDSLDELEKKIQKAAEGKSVESIAFANHGNSEGFFINKDTSISLDEWEKNQKIQKFWKSLSSLVEKEGRIDLLACNLYGSQEGKQLIQKMESHTGVNFAASKDLTGNYASGGNWMLESDSVSVLEHYFQKEIISEWNHTLGIKNYNPGKKVVSDLPLHDESQSISSQVFDLTAYIPDSHNTKKSYGATLGSASASNVGLLYPTDRSHSLFSDWDTPEWRWNEQTRNADNGFYKNNENALLGHRNERYRQDNTSLSFRNEAHGNKIYYHLPDDSSHYFRRGTAYDSELHGKTSHVVDFIFGSFELKVKSAWFDLESSEPPLEIWVVDPDIDKNDLNQIVSGSDASARLGGERETGVKKILNKNDSSLMGYQISWKELLDDANCNPGSDIGHEHWLTKEEKILQYIIQRADGDKIYARVANQNAGGTAGDGFFSLTINELSRLRYGAVHSGDDYVDQDASDLKGWNEIEKTSTEKVEISMISVDVNPPETETFDARMFHKGVMQILPQHFSITDQDRMQKRELAEKVSEHNYSAPGQHYLDKYCRDQWTDDYELEIKNYDQIKAKYGEFRRREESGLYMPLQGNVISYRDIENGLIQFSNNIVQDQEGLGILKRMMTNSLGVLEDSKKVVNNEFSNQEEGISALKRLVEGGHRDFQQDLAKMVRSLEIHKQEWEKKLHSLLIGIDAEKTSAIETQMNRIDDMINSLQSIQEGENPEDSSSFISRLAIELAEDTPSYGRLQQIIRDDFVSYFDFYENFESASDAFFRIDFNFAVKNQGDRNVVKALGKDVNDIQWNEVSWSIFLDEPEVDQLQPPPIVPDENSYEKDPFNQLRNIEVGRAWVIGQNDAFVLEQHNTWGGTPYFLSKGRSNFVNGEDLGTDKLEKVTSLDETKEEGVTSYAWGMKQEAQNSESRLALKDSEKRDPQYNSDEFAYQITQINQGKNSDNPWRVFRRKEASLVNYADERELAKAIDEKSEKWEELKIGDTFTQKEINGGMIAVLGGLGSATDREDHDEGSMGEIAIDAFHYRTMLPEEKINGNDVPLEKRRSTFAQPFYVKQTGISSPPVRNPAMTGTLSGFRLGEEAHRIFPITSRTLEYVDPDDSPLHVAFQIQSGSATLYRIKERPEEVISDQESIWQKIEKGVPPWDLMEKGVHYEECIGGDIFTQADVNNGKIWYRDTGQSEKVVFDVTDNIQAGVLDLKNQEITIAISSVEDLIAQESNKPMQFDGNSTETTIAIPGRVPKKLKAEGDHMIIPNVTELFPSAGNHRAQEGTIEFLFQPTIPDDSYDVALEQVLFSFAEDDFDPNDGAIPLKKNATYITYNRNSKELNLNIYKKGNQGPGIFTLKKDVTLDQWHHFSFGWSDAEESLSLFIDGEKVDLSSDYKSYFPSGFYDNSWADQLTFGAVGNESFFHGKIWKIRAWNEMRKDANSLFTSTLSSQPTLSLSLNGDEEGGSSQSRLIANEVQRVLVLETDVLEGASIDLNSYADNNHLIPAKEGSITIDFSGKVNTEGKVIPKGTLFKIGNDSTYYRVNKEVRVVSNKVRLDFSPSLEKEIDLTVPENLSVQSVTFSAQVSDHYGVFIGSSAIEELPIGAKQISLNIKDNIYHWDPLVGSDNVPETGDYLAYAFAYLVHVKKLYEHPSPIKNENGVYYGGSDIANPSLFDEEREKKMEEISAELFYIREEMKNYQEYMNQGIPYDPQLLFLKDLMGELSVKLRVYPHGALLENFYQDQAIGDKLSEAIGILESYLLKEKKIVRDSHPSLQNILLSQFWRAGEQVMSESMRKLDENLQQIHEGISLLTKLEGILNSDLKNLEYSHDGLRPYLSKKIERSAEGLVTKSFYTIRNDAGDEISLDPLQLSEEAKSLWKESFRLFAPLFDCRDSEGNVTKGIISQVDDLIHSLPTLSDENNTGLSAETMRTGKVLKDQLRSIQNTLFYTSSDRYQESSRLEEGFHAQWDQKDQDEYTETREGITYTYEGFTLTAATRILNRIYGTVGKTIFKEEEDSIQADYREGKSAIKDGSGNIVQEEEPGTNPHMNRTYINENFRKQVADAIDLFRSEISTVKEGIKKANLVFEEFVRSSFSMNEDILENAMEILRRINK